MKTFLGIILYFSNVLTLCEAWTFNINSPFDGTTTAKATALSTDPSFVPPNVDDFAEDGLREAAAKLQRTQEGVSYIHWPSSTAKTGPAVVLVHGFDSSALEYRRLGPLLAENGINTYAVDLWGWGFTKLNKEEDYSAKAKLEALQTFLDAMQTEYVLAGASLGGAAVIQLSHLDNNRQKGLILLDAQGFVDGIGPMAALPTPVAKLGVAVLKSWPLRSMANQMSYYDTKTYATDEAVRVGRLHCSRDGWADALVNFMQSGGFSPSQYVSKIKVPTLIVWGRQDGILEPEYAQRFMDEIPQAQLEWMDKCGHVPHLEQPQATSQVIADFVKNNLEVKSKV